MTDGQPTAAEREAEAKARKAIAEAEKAEAELAEYRSDAAAAARAAALAKQTAEAEQATRSAEVIVDPGLVRRQKEADLRKQAVEADSAAAKSQRERVAALIPDLGKVGASELDVSGDEALMSASLARHALGAAAVKVAKKVEVKIAGRSTRILITSDPDLASPDGVYLEVSSGLEQLGAAATDLLTELDRQPRVEGRSVAIAGEAIAGAIAGVVPALLSLAVAKRSVTSKALDVDSRAAVAEVAGHLVGEQRTIIVDDFRLVPSGAVSAAETDLRAKRSTLLTKQIGLEAQRSATQIELTQANATAARLQKRYDDQKPGEHDPHLGGQLEEALREVARLSTEFEVASGRVGLITTLSNGIDEFLGAIHATPDGAKRSLFVTAALHEQLHGGDAAATAFTHVLYIGGAGGSIDQLTNDRPLWFEDKFSVIATANITFVLIGADSAVDAAGVQTGAARVSGTIGSSISIGTVEVPAIG